MSISAGILCSRDRTLRTWWTCIRNSKGIRILSKETTVENGNPNSASFTTPVLLRTPRADLSTKTATYSKTYFSISWRVRPTFSYASSLNFRSAMGFIFVCSLSRLSLRSVRDYCLYCKLHIVWLYRIYSGLLSREWEVQTRRRPEGRQKAGLPSVIRSDTSYKLWWTFFNPQIRGM